MYINGAAAISPLPVFNALQTGISLELPDAKRLVVAEPDYSTLIDPKLIRRMSRIIRMGVVTALEALRQAGIQDPTAIITGTAYGCLQDTGIFLKKMVENQEEMLAPTAFIQSTHNTVGAQVALLLKCNAYNTTYVQRSHSFELSLSDAQLWLTENQHAAVLVGSADELTDYSFAILERVGIFRSHPAGEGAVYFVVQNKPGEHCWAKITTVKTLFEPTPQEVLAALKAFNLSAPPGSGGIDLLLSGEKNGNTNEQGYSQIYAALNPATPVFRYKQYCGEYPTAASFATWLAAYWLYKQEIVTKEFTLHSPKRILVYQKDEAGYHSFIQLEAC